MAGRRLVREDPFRQEVVPGRHNRETPRQEPRATRSVTAIFHAGPLLVMLLDASVRRKTRTRVARPFPALFANCCYWRDGYYIGDQFRCREDPYPAVLASMTSQCRPVAEVVPISGASANPLGWLSSSHGGVPRPLSVPDDSLSRYTAVQKPCLTKGGGKRSATLIRGALTAFFSRAIPQRFLVVAR